MFSKIVGLANLTPQQTLFPKLGLDVISMTYDYMKH